MAGRLHLLELEEPRRSRTPHDVMQVAEIERRLSTLGNLARVVARVFAAGPIPMQLYRPDGRSVMVNDAFRRLFGSEPPPEYRVWDDELAAEAGVLDALRRAFAGQSVSTPPIWYDPREARNVSVSRGHRVAVTSHLLPLMDESGAVTYVLICFTDRTREMRASAVLASVIDAAPVGISILDRDLRYTEINRRLAEMAGLPREAFLGRAVDEVLPNEPYRKTVARALRSVITSEQPKVDVDIAWRSASDATPYSAIASYFPLQVHGEIVGAASVVVDVTERNRLLASLEAEQRRLRQLQGFTAAIARATTVSEMAQVIVSQGRSAFGAARSAVGLLSEDEQTVSAIASAGFPEEVMNAWQHASLAQSQPFTQALRTGEPLYFADRTSFAAAYPLLVGFRAATAEGVVALPLNVAGRSFGVVLLSFDHTISLSEEQRGDFEAFAVLCAQALDRALLFDLAQKERRRAEAANRTKDVFLATVSHELRTPLNSILGWATLLRGGKLAPDAVGKALSTVERNARAQAQLIDDLLDVARITAGKLDLRRENVDLGSVVLAAVDATRPAADAAGLKMTLAVAPNLPQVMGDPERLQQVAWNLLSNAVKFTPRGGHIVVTVRPEDDDERHVELVVEDTGRGIDSSALPFVFDRFRQAEEGIDRSHGGLGLGLAIVRELVNAHGGDVDAFSAGIGRGARFTVTLPTAGVHGDQLRSIPPVRAEPAPDVLLGLRVLVVDDDDDARTLLATVLRASGCSVTVADSYASAVARLEESVPDVLVSDIGMPGQDGYTLIEHVRRLPPEEGGNVPAVALTAFARTEDRHRALLAGFQTHLAKPVDPSDLVFTIAKVTGLLHEHPGHASP